MTAADNLKTNTVWPHYSAVRLTADPDIPRGELGSRFSGFLGSKKK